MPSETAGRRVATHLKAMHGMPRENIVKMLTNRAMLQKFEMAKRKKKMPEFDALAFALGEVFAGAYTKEHTQGEPYKFLCTEDNLKVVRAALDGKAVSEKRSVIVPSVGKLQHMLPDMEPYEVTAMLALEQEGINEDKEPRPHVLKLLGERVMNDMAKANKPELSEAEIAERKKLLEDDDD